MLITFQINRKARLGLAHQRRKVFQNQNIPFWGKTGDWRLPNDLVLRDMGYSGVDNFLIIEALNAFWLSRLPLTVPRVDNSMNRVFFSGLASGVDRA